MEKEEVSQQKAARSKRRHTNQTYRARDKRSIQREIEIYIKGKKKYKQDIEKIDSLLIFLSGFFGLYGFLPFFFCFGISQIEETEKGVGKVCFVFCVAASRNLFFFPFWFSIFM